MTDPLLRLLNGLPPASLDPARADRIRDRCHAALARRRPRPVMPADRGPRVWTSIVAAFGGLYVTAVVREVLAVYGLL